MTHSSFRVPFLLLALLAAGRLVGQGPDSRPVDDRRELYYKVEIGGERVGWGVSVFERVARDDEDLLAYTERGVLRLGRLGQVAVIRSEVRYVERPDGRLVEVVGESELSDRTSSALVRFDGDTAEVTVTAAGDERRMTREVYPETVGPRRLRRDIVARFGDAPVSFPATVWGAETNECVDVDVSIAAPETIELAPGDERLAYRVEQKYAELPMRYVSWIDASGLELRSLLETSGLEIVGTLTTREDALAAETIADRDLPDLLAATSAIDRHQLPAPRRCARAVLRITPKGGEFAAPLLESARQRVITTDAATGALWVETCALVPAPGETGQLPMDELPEDIEPFLAASASIQCDAEAIRAAARDVVGDERDAWAAAQRLERWVGEHVTDKGMGVAWATALEVFEDRGGDCSEHAVLMAAMCRAAGIPCRVAIGSLHIGGIWAGHAWNEVWIAGDWYALDATVAAGRADALRITLGVGALSDDDGPAMFAGVMAHLGKLEVETLEVGADRPVRPAATCGRLVDGRYVDRLFGIAFDVPADVPLACRRPGAELGFDLLDVAEGAAAAPYRIALRAFDAMPDGGIPAPLLRGNGSDGVVDGRPAVFETRGDDRRVLVVSGGIVFEFRFQDIDPDEQPAIDALLRSIDFDG